MITVPYSVLAQWQCPFNYGCGKRQVNDEAVMARNRLRDGMRMLRNSRTRPEEGQTRRDERGLDNMAFHEGSRE